MLRKSLLALAALASTLEARIVFVLPGGTSTNQTVQVVSADGMVVVNSFQGAPASFLALANPSGTRYFVIANSGNATVSVVDGTTFNLVQAPFSLLNNATSAVVTPDGRKLLVTAGTLFVFDISAASAVIPNPISVNAGATPTDVAVSLDSSRAFVLSAGERVLRAVDLATNSVLANTITIPGQATGVTVGPNGFVYVTTENRLFEIDPRTFTLTRVDGIALIGRPGKPVFSPDGRFAVMVNLFPQSGNSAAILVDLSNRSVSGTVPNFGVTLDTLAPAGSNRMFAHSSQNQSVYEITLSPLNVAAASFVNLATTTGINAIAVSNELPQPRFLYLATPQVLHRVDLNTLERDNGVGLTAPGGRLSFASGASTGAPASVLQYNNNQALATGATSLPLIVRVLDPNGRPVLGAPVIWSSTSNATIQNAGGSTNAEGFAQATVVAPPSAATVTINAGLGQGGALVASFTLTVGAAGGPAPGVTAGVSIFSGNGPVVRQFANTTEPMVVLVRDANGVPVPSAVVDFTITTGAGRVIPAVGISAAESGTSASVLTDANGRAGVTFQGALSSPLSITFEQSTITATHAASGTSVSLTATTTPLATAGGGLAPDPTVILLTPPEGDLRLTGQAGQKLTGAIAAQVALGGSLPIPNVGIRVTTDFEPGAGPTASCDGNPLSDVSGVVTCDLVLGNKTGEATLRVITGGFNVKTIVLTVTPGPPSQVRIIQGNNQSGNAGQDLPLALVAEVTDVGGNLLPGVPVTWTVVTPGTVTLRNQISTTDIRGRVSSLVTLGGIPGSHQVRVTAGEAAAATFTVIANITVGRVVPVSGGGQTVALNQAFPLPLVVRVEDAQGRPLGGLPVTFAVTSGAATLGTPSANTNAQGEALTTVRAGATAGSIVITATAAGQSTTFTLTSRVPGPSVLASGFVNAASGQPGVVAGSLATIRGSGLAQNITGCIEPETVTGPLPTTLSGVTVQFGAHVAPIMGVCNLAGAEQVTVQVPWELGAGLVPVQITAGGGASIVSNVQVLAAQPGIFETPGPDGRRIAVVVRPNGTFVSPSNPAQRGEELRVYVTGLGVVLPVTSTNQPGIGQRAFLPVIVGVNNAGVRVISAEYAQNLIGVYAVTFEVPADAQSGREIALAVAVLTPDGQSVQSNGSRLAIQ